MKLTRAGQWKTCTTEPNSLFCYLLFIFMITFLLFNFWLLEVFAFLIIINYFPTEKVLFIHLSSIMHELIHFQPCMQTELKKGGNLNQKIPKVPKFTSGKSNIIILDKFH